MQVKMYRGQDIHKSNTSKHKTHQTVSPSPNAKRGSTKISKHAKTLSHKCIKHKKVCLFQACKNEGGWIIKYQKMPKLSISNALNIPKLKFHTEMYKNYVGFLNFQYTPKLLDINIQMPPQELFQTQMQKY